MKSVIKEDEEEDEALHVVKPLPGIENAKFAPIIKAMDEIEVAITPYVMTPLATVTKPFISQLKSFNEYTETTREAKSSNSIANKSAGMLFRNKKGAASHG